MVKIVQKILQRLSIFEYLIEYLKWQLDLKFQLNLLRCCFSNPENLDRYNIFSFCVFYLMPLVVFSIVYLIGSLLFRFGMTPLFFIILVILVIWALIVYYTFLLNDAFCQDSEKHLVGTQNSLYSPDCPHHGIIFAQQTHPFRKMFISDSVDLLVSLFGEKIPFKVYPIYCENDFQSVYSNPNIKWLWIIGHGWRGGFCYSENGRESLIEYARYQKKTHLNFIAQLHCNSNPGLSLIEINGLQPDHDIDHIRFPFQNRCYIKNKVKRLIELCEV